MSDTFFVTGISTEVGKTVVSAIITEALQTDYWKPIQAGELACTDTDKVENWVSNSKSRFFEPAFSLLTAMSPHAAAEIDDIKIALAEIKRPQTKNKLVIEGAGGLLVPINKTQTMIDLIQPTDKVIVVSKHYLGSINHTLLTIEALRNRSLNIFGIVFNGDENITTERIIAEITQVPILGRIENEPYINHHVISEYAEKLKNKLLKPQAD